jgi:hypothetical protein
METLILRTKNKRESRLVLELMSKMKIAVQKLSKEEQEDFVFGNLINSAIKKGEARPAAIEKIIRKWK